MTQRNLTIEECPLKNGTTCHKRPGSFKVPLRVIRLCLLGILVPCLLIVVPLYMRYRVYGHQLYPLTMSDMRLIDNKISTTWCQRQIVKVNTTFNAFLLPKSPTLSDEVKPLSMVRHLILEDDTKEYWGFYLLAGSSVTVSTCVRWPGASLIVIRGHKHLHECAYIGDNSSEEIEELMEAIREGTFVDPNIERPNNTDDAPANTPDLMKRHRSDVEFHHPIHRNSSKPHTIDEYADISDISDPIMLQYILNSLQEKSKKKKSKMGQKAQEEVEEHAHVQRNSTIASSETKNVKIRAPDFLEHLNDRKTHAQGRELENMTSSEIVSRLVAKLDKMGGRGASVLKKLNEKYNETRPSVSKKAAAIEEAEDHLLNMMGRHYQKPTVDFDDNIDNYRRRKRDLILRTAFEKEMNEHDEENDLAVEEGFVPDGIADHRGIFNDTTLNDMSNSEFWSSFSSSEEALLNCAGLILNLPLTPHHKCSSGLTESEAEETNLANTITYRVPTNGYYFFVFSSENEIQPNYVRIQFHLQKTVYNVSNPVANCSNSKSKCSLDLRFFSSEKVVMEIPVLKNDSLWNEEFVVVSECEPRTAIYVICVISVPIFIMLFAFS